VAQRAAEAVEETVLAVRPSAQLERAHHASRPGCQHRDVSRRRFQATK